jgi:hypothetical protein
MRKITGLLAATLLGGMLTMLGLAAPAHASGTGFYVHRDSTIVTYEGCHNYGVYYSVPAEIASTYSWSIDINVHDPAGTTSDFTFVYSDGDPASGTAYIYLCDWERAGTFTIESELNYYGTTDGYETYVDETDFDSDTVYVRKPFTRTKVAVNDATASYGQKLTFTVASTKEYATGYFSNRYETVALQKYVGGAWRTIATRDTNSNGKAWFPVVWKHRTTVRVRAVTVATDTARSSYSPELKVF